MTLTEEPKGAGYAVFIAAQYYRPILCMLYSVPDLLLLRSQRQFSLHTLWLQLFVRCVLLTEHFQVRFSGIRKAI